MAQIEDKIIESQGESFGEYVVRKLPSQIKDDPELKEKQERNVQWLIDTLVPQSKSEVALTAGSFFVGGPIGKLFAKKAATTLSPYFVSILGSGHIKPSALKEYVNVMIEGVHKNAFTANWQAIGQLQKQSPSFAKLKIGKSVDGTKAFIIQETEMIGGKWVQKNANAFDDAVKGLIKEAETAHKKLFGTANRPKKASLNPSPHNEGMSKKTRDFVVRAAEKSRRRR